MQIKSIFAVAGAVLLATAGAAQAGASFDALTGVEATEMSQTELSDVRGAVIIVKNFPSGRGNLGLDYSMTTVMSPTTKP